MVLRCGRTWRTGEGRASYTNGAGIA